MAFPAPIARLIEELRRLPGIGSKSAQRLAYHLAGRPPAEVRDLAAALGALPDALRHCSRCHQLTEADPCDICAAPGRDARTVCVVEQPGDLLAIESSGEYRGLYHVLHGALDPLSGIGPAELRIEDLVRRIEAGGVEELILATNATVEGEATAAYLARLVGRPGLRLTRPAQGLAAGVDLEYTDRLTLARALRGRRAFD